MLGPIASGQSSPTANSEWPQHGLTSYEDRLSPLSQIDRESVRQLGLAWSYATGSEPELEAAAENGPRIRCGSADDAKAIHAYVLDRAWREPGLLEKMLGVLADNACIPVSWLTQ